MEIVYFGVDCGYLIVQLSERNNSCVDLDCY